MADRYKETENQQTGNHEVPSSLDLSTQPHTDESQKLLVKTSVAAQDILVSVTHLNLSSTILTRNAENECQNIILQNTSQYSESGSDASLSLNPFSGILKFIQRYYIALVLVIICLVPLLIYSSSHKSTSTKNEASHYQYERIMPKKTEIELFFKASQQPRQRQRANKHPKSQSE